MVGMNSAITPESVVLSEVDVQEMQRNSVDKNMNFCSNQDTIFQCIRRVDSVVQTVYNMERCVFLDPLYIVDAFLFQCIPMYSQVFGRMVEHNSGE